MWADEKIEDVLCRTMLYCIGDEASGIACISGFGLFIAMLNFATLVSIRRTDIYLRMFPYHSLCSSIFPIYLSPSGKERFYNDFPQLPEESLYSFNTGYLGCVGHMPRISQRGNRLKVSESAKATTWLTHVDCFIGYGSCMSLYYLFLYSDMDKIIIIDIDICNTSDTPQMFRNPRSHMKPTQIECSKGSFNQIPAETTVHGDIRCQHVPLSKGPMWQRGIPVTQSSC